MTVDLTKYSLSVGVPAPTTGTANLAGNTIYLPKSESFRFRQGGTVRAVKFFSGAISGITSYVIQVWRLAGTTYTLIGQSEELLPSLVDGQIVTVELASPITGVLKGDYYAVVVRSTGGTYWVYGSTDTGTSTKWKTAAASYAIGNTLTEASCNTASNIGIRVEFYMHPKPALATIGDSHFNGGSPPSAADELATLLATRIGAGTVTQNTAVSGQSITIQIQPRFARDLVALYPSYAVVGTGTNDAGTNGYVAAVTAMLNAAVAAGIKLIVLGIPPVGAGIHDAALMAIYDGWNAQVSALIAASYPTAQWIDTQALVGVYRSDGPAGNKWDLNATYDSGDHLHLTAAGYAVWAQAIYDQVFTPGVDAVCAPSTTLGPITLTSGTVYKAVWTDMAGNVRDVVAGTWGALATANYTACRAPMTEQGTTGKFYAAMPTGLNPSNDYQVMIFTDTATGFGDSTNYVSTQRFTPTLMGAVKAAMDAVKTKTDNLPANTATTLGALATAASQTTAQNALTKIQAATYDSATDDHGVAVLSNGARVSVGATGRATVES